MRNADFTQQTVLELLARSWRELIQSKIIRQACLYIILFWIRFCGQAPANTLAPKQKIRNARESQTIII